MNELTSVLVISEDSVLFENIRANNPLESTVDHLQLSSKPSQESSEVEFIKSALGDKEMSIMVLDLSPIKRVNQHEVLQQLKRQWPKVALIVVGESEDVTNVLQPNTQPLIYRAFKLPVNAKQLALSFEPALGYFTNHDGVVQSQAVSSEAPSAKSESKKSIVLVGFGVAALMVGAWYLLSGDSSSEKQVTKSELVDTNSNGENGSSSSDQSADTTIATSGNDIDLTIDLGELALKDGRLISPANDNAAYYFEQALRQDPYNNRAYIGNKDLAQFLINGYSGLIANGEYIAAYEYLDAYQKIVPLDRKMDDHYKRAGKMVTAHFQKMRDSDNAKALKLARPQYEALAERLDENASLASILKHEEESKAKIESALKKGLLFPPDQPNAYTLLKNAISKKLISRATHESLAEEMEMQLLKRADALSKLTALNEEQHAELKLVLQHAKLLGFNSSLMTSLKTKLDTHEKALAEAAVEEVKEEEAVANIAPAKLLSRTQVRYPKRALDRDIEGWVEVSFKIDRSGAPTDIKVVDSEPSNIFDSAAINSVEEWEFLPAMDMQTGRPVETEIKTTRMHFKLEGK